MTRRRSVKYRRFAVLALGVLAFAVAGCGGDDASGTSDETQVEESTADETTAEETTAEETTEEETTEEETTAAIGDISEDCLEFASVGSKVAEAMGAAGSGGDISATSELFDELVANAPDEIKGDLEVLSESVGQLAEALEGVDVSSGAVPDAETLAKLQEVLGSIDSAEIQAASANITAWTAENCGAS